MNIRILSIFLIVISDGITLSEGSRRMIDPLGNPVMDLWSPPSPGYSDRKYPPFNGRSVELKPIEFNNRKFLQWKLILNSEEAEDPSPSPTSGQGAFLDLLSHFYPKRNDDEINGHVWKDIQEFGLHIYTYFTADGRMCELGDQGYHMRVVEEDRGRSCVTFYGVKGERVLCSDGYHCGEVLRQNGAGVLSGSFVFKESFFWDR